VKFFFFTKNINPMLQWILMALFSLAATSNFNVPASRIAPKNADAPVKIQVALLLDTSNSMDGLIDQAKSQLWKMVNKLADAQRQNKDVMLEIALFEYGNDFLDARKGYVRQVQGMKSDLDGLSERLFALHTNGGNEFCGWAIQTSLDSLGWSDNADDLRMIIIAGNEPFNQGTVDFHISCENAFKKDIIVNTIFCGKTDEGRKTHWFDCAQITKGLYLNIDTDQKVHHISTPFDTTLMRLNNDLNGTYLGYGRLGTENKSRQLLQDENAKSYGAGNMSQRASAKAKKSYSNAEWDVVDAQIADSNFVKNAKPEELPEAMKGKSAAENTQIIDNLRKKRLALQKELLEVDKKMQAFTAAELKKSSATQTLDQVLIQALVAQARAKGFDFKE
jgi:hypothetical protein